MTAFTQAIESGALTPYHLAKGIWLDESDHGLTLVHTDNKGNTQEIAHWGTYAEMLDIRNEADNYLTKKGIKC